MMTPGVSQGWAVSAPAETIFIMAERFGKKYPNV